MWESHSARHSIMCSISRSAHSASMLNNLFEKPSGLKDRTYDDGLTEAVCMDWNWLLVILVNGRRQMTLRGRRYDKVQLVGSSLKTRRNV